MSQQNILRDDETLRRVWKTPILRIADNEWLFLDPRSDNKSFLMENSDFRTVKEATTFVHVQCVVVTFTEC